MNVMKVINRKARVMLVIAAMMIAMVPAPAHARFSVALCTTLRIMRCRLRRG